MAKTSIRVTHPRRLPETVQTLRRLGIPCSSSDTALLTISSVPEKKSSRSSKGIGRVPSFLVPSSTSPGKTLALLRKLGASSPGPFFAAGKAGAINAALFAAACLAPRHPKIRRALDLFRSRQTNSVPQNP